MERSWRGENEYHGSAGPVEVNPINSPYLLHEPLMNSAVPAGFNNSADLAAETSEGFARGEATIDKRGRRVSSSTAYLRPALGRSNLAVRTGVLVHRIQLESQTACGVEYEVGGERRTVRARREVILSAGTYNSPHLLMLSGIGPGVHLAEHGIEVVADRPGVGKNLSEHANVSMEFDAVGPVTFLNQLRFDRVVASALRWAFFGSGPLATQLNSCNVVIRTRPHLDRPDVQFMANPLRFDAKIWFPLVTRPQSHVFWAGIVALHPRIRGWVRLKSRDSHELPAVTLNLLSDPADLETLREGIRAARVIYRTPPQATLTGAERLPGEALETDDQLDAFIRETANVAMHPVGTCAMGAGDAAVVDPQLRVIGVERLRVVDASVMPTVPGGNTHATTVMIAEKAADIIRGVLPARAEIQDTKGRKT
jgi:choline dehydrogenase